MKTGKFTAQALYFWAGKLAHAAAQNGKGRSLFICASFIESGRRDQYIV